MAFLDKLTELAKNVTDQAVELAKNVGDATGEIARNVADKTNDLLEVGKLNGQIASSNSAIEELKTRLGDHYWNLYVNGQQLDDDAVVLCTTIKEYVEEIENLKAQLADMKAKREAAAGQICKACGAHNTLDAVYCKSCGSKLEQEVVDVEPTPVDEAETDEHTCCKQDAGEDHECCCKQDAEEAHECCCKQDAEEAHECCCKQDAEEDHECCCKQEEAVDCASENAQEAEEEETVVEISTTKVCPNCGAENDGENTFCNQCGARL
ncbi:MAG: zinc-ribbon domain-containing protein [Clostridia bacterium]|nr:zinc-ribbon domain-containing protein [Clostridia bacterium]